MMDSSTTPKGTSFPPPNPFKEVFVCSNLKSVIHISSKIDLNRTSTEVPVSTRIRSNLLAAAMALITKVSSCGYRISSSSSSVYMIGTCLILARLVTGVLKSTSLLVMAYLA